MGQFMKHIHSYSIPVQFIETETISSTFFLFIHVISAEMAWNAFTFFLFLNIFSFFEGWGVDVPHEIAASDDTMTRSSVIYNTNDMIIAGWQLSGAS